jgi:hypothetical protein
LLDTSVSPPATVTRSLKSGKDDYLACLASTNNDGEKPAVGGEG